MRAVAALLAAVLLAGCGGAGVPDAPENPIQGDPLPNQGYPGLEEPDLGSTLAEEVPNPVPPQPDTLLAGVRERDDLSTLVELVERAGLEDLLTAEEDRTLFAPSDEAWAAVPDDVLARLRDDPAQLERLLRHHVVLGSFSAPELEDVEAVANLAGQPIDMTSEGGELGVEGAAVVAADVAVGNGIAHVIDTVLFLPPVPED